MSIWKKAAISIGAVLFILLLSFVFPVKFCLMDYPYDSGEEFYVVRYDNTLDSWIFMGDKDGMLDWNTASDIFVTVEGVDLTDILSADLWFDFQETYFVLWGQGEEHIAYDEAGNRLGLRSIDVQCTDWDVLGEFNSHNGFRYNFSRKYLTIYDYKWFDALRMYDPVFKWY